MPVKPALLRFHGNRRRERVYTPFIAILKLPFKFYRSWSSQQDGKARAYDRPRRGRFGDQVRRFQSWARGRTHNRIPLLLTARWITGRFSTGREPRSGRARQKSKRRCQMFQGHIDLDAATPVQASAIPDVLFERGLYWAIGRSRVVNLVAAPKWLNLAALQDRADSIQQR